MQRAEERRRVEEHNKVREQDVTKTYCSFANLFTVFINIVTHVNIAVSHVQKGGVWKHAVVAQCHYIIGYSNMVFYFEKSFLKTIDF